MDTSATVRKAVTEAEKQKHKDEGRCFECSKQGHIACSCPSRAPRARATTTTTDEASVKEKDDPSVYASKAKVEDFSDGNVLADYAFKLSEDAREAFVRKVNMMGEEMGFLGA